MLWEGCMLQVVHSSLGIAVAGWWDNRITPKF